MNIIKKLFGRKKSTNAQTQEPECWYNDYDQKKKSGILPEVEGGALSGPNQAEYSSAQWLSKHQ